MRIKFNMKELLSDNSKAEAAPGKAPESGFASFFEVTGIPLEKISASPSNKYGIRDIEELAASIEEMGLLHNLVVKAPDESGMHELISGERRFLALKLLEWPAAPCKVEREESPTMQELKLFHANAQARVLTPFEKTMQAARLKELLQQLKAEGHKFSGRMRDIVADIVKVSPSQVGRMESIDKNLSPELKREFEAGNINMTAAYNASTLKPEAQAAVHEEYKATGRLMVPPDPPPIAPEPPANSETAAPEPPALACVELTNHGGEVFAYNGNLAMVSAVNARSEHFGAISAGEDITDTDITALAIIVTELCIERLQGGKKSLDVFYNAVTDAIEAAFDRADD